jgi:hypothetical protein
MGKAGGAALVLGVNVVLLILLGSLTLATQVWLASRRHAATTG